MNKWSEDRLGNLLETVIDYRGKTPPKAKSGIPAITAANVKDGMLTLDGASFVSKETYKSWTTRGYPEPGDVIITTEAPVAEVASFPSDGTYLLTRRVICLRPKDEILDKSFLLYLLMAPSYRSKILSATRGSTVPRVLKTDITNLTIKFPRDFVEQKKAIAILKNLDNRIRLNQKENQTLEKIAFSLFEQWFLYFEGDVDEKDLKEETLNSICELCTTSVNPSKIPNEYFYHYSIPNYDETKFPTVEQGSTIKSNKYLVNNNAILVSKLNPATKRIWCPNPKNNLRSICSTEFMQFIPNHEENRAYLWCLLNSEHFYSSILRTVSGTTGSRQRAQPKHVIEQMCQLPSQEVQVAFSNLVNPIIKQINLNIEENEVMKKLKREILPWLFSGEIDFSKIVLE